MRKTKTCPKCECKKLLKLDVVADAQGGGSPGMPLHFGIRHEGYSFVGNEKTRAVGKVEAVLSSECGYTELYCGDISEIKPDGKYISWLS
jgi:predicted nucleic-acid-binding Zn-ribbon protein